MERGWIPPKDAISVSRLSRPGDAVIAGKNDNGIFCIGTLFQGVQYSAKLIIHEGDTSHVCLDPLFPGTTFLNFCKLFKAP